MLLPMAVTAARVFIPCRLFAGEAVGKDVGPAVVIKIVRESEEVIGVRVIDAERAFKTRQGLFGAVGFLAFESGFGGIELVAVCEAGPLIPIGPGGDIVNAVVVEIAEGSAFSPELVVELIFEK